MNKLTGMMIFLFVFLPICAFFGAGFFALPSDPEEIRVNPDLHLDFGNFTKKEKVILNKKEYSAILLKNYTLQEARIKCEKLAGTIAWNRVTSSDPSLKSYWVEIQNKTDLDNANIRECFDEVSSLSRFGPLRGANRSSSELQILNTFC